MTSTAPSRPRRLARASAAVLSLGLAATIAGCSGNADASSAPSAGASGSAKPSASATPTPTAKHYGDVVGSGKQVKIADGTYETIALPANSPLYESTAGADVQAAGYSKADAAAAQKLVVDYMTTQFLDSTALETKDSGLADWMQKNATEWFSPEVASQIAAAAPGQAQVLLGDSGGTTTIPSLIHDGKPRLSKATLQPAGTSPYSAQDGKGIEYNFTYSATYRVPSAAAVALAAGLAKETPEQFLSSSAAKPKVKSGGEVSYGANGTARLIVDKASSGKWEIIGFKNATDYDLSDFAVSSDPSQ